MSERPPSFLEVDEGEGRRRLVDNRHAALAYDLRKAHFGEEIIQRVLRLNPPESLNEGCLLRGISPRRDERRRVFWLQGAITRREFVQRYGKEAFERLPKDVLIRRGRRIYVSHRAERHL